MAQKHQDERYGKQRCGTSTGLLADCYVAIVPYPVDSINDVCVFDPQGQSIVDV